MMKEQTDAMTRALFGVNAVHVPFNAIIQGAGTEKGISRITIVGQSSFPTKLHPLTFGSKMIHQLVLGDIVFRPHIAIESNAFIGYGIGGLAKMCPTEWFEVDHNIILNMTSENDLNKRLQH